MEKGLGLCPDASRGSSDSGDTLSPLCKLCAPYQPKFSDPIQVACGAAHTVIVARDGYNVWSWDRGRCRVLGTGNELDCYTPSKVRWPPAIEDLLKEFPDHRRIGRNPTHNSTNEELFHLCHGMRF
ncbi:hypothetical protein AHAS_Ahas13G0031100 [Arachis hypogaea]